MVIDNILKANVRGYWILLGTCPSCTTPLPLGFPHTLHLWPHKETARSRGSGQTPLHPSRSPVLGIWTASAHLHPIPTTSPSLGRRVHLLAAARGAGGCPKASAGHEHVFARALVPLPRVGQRYTQEFGCGHLPFVHSIAAPPPSSSRPARGRWRYFYGGLFLLTK